MASDIKSISEAELRAALQIDRNDLDTEIERQASLFYEVAERAALAVSLRDEAKSTMDAEYANACNRVRRKGDEDAKLTEGKVKELASKDEKYRAADAAYLEAKRDADLAATMRDAFDMRGKMLRELAQLYIAGYFQLSGVRASRARMSDHAAEAGKRALAGTRRSGSNG